MHMIKKISRAWAHLPLHSQKQRRQAIMVTVFVLGLFGVAYSMVQYTAQRYTQMAEQASLQYDEFAQILSKNEQEAKVLGEKLLSQYPKTPYAQLVNLNLATEAQKAGKSDDAKHYLKTLLNDNQGSLIHIARLRLARLLTNEQAYEEAIALLNQPNQAEFAMLYQDTLGDIYWQQAQFDKARAAYSKAIQETPPGISAAWIRLKHAQLEQPSAEDTFEGENHG